jgi:hypothetical protein
VIEPTKGNDWANDAFYNVDIFRKKEAQFFFLSLGTTEFYGKKMGQK